MMNIEIIGRPFRSLHSVILRTLTASSSRHICGLATAGQSNPEGPSSLFAFTENAQNTSRKEDNNIYINGPKSSYLHPDSSSVTMPMSFMTGSIVGKKFYKKVTTREADDGIGWTVLLDYRTLKTPAKRPLKCPTLALAKAIAAEWEYQETDGIRPFTMPLMKLACTAFERVPLTRPKIIENLMKKFNQDLLFCRAPGDNDITALVLGTFVLEHTPSVPLFLSFFCSTHYFCLIPYLVLFVWFIFILTLSYFLTSIFTD
ncbi:hypothetical protein DM860_007662 [Cuscuta australis]|uniref:ATP synthase mitochondrial F1 complex assembly factor 2 n=1 Tax=Cuscuta australis TaxID=267555 RepID=A0A328E4J6_9ASTE|nr:hypothetical protein DM860_007662 [Cuscuta australis]